MFMASAVRRGGVNLKGPYILMLIGMFVIAGMAQVYPCLPSDVKEDAVVGHRAVKSKDGKVSKVKITVKQTLKKMSSRCVGGELVDKKGKNIRFYFLQGCWGNPPADYQEILDRQAKEIAELKKHYTVIEMTCNPSGLPRQSIS